MYCKVENGTPQFPVVERIGLLPNISNIDGASNEVKRELGWYVVVNDPLPEYDTLTHRLESVLTLDGTIVRRSFSVVERPSGEYQNLLTESRKAAIQKINTEAGQCRQKYMTDIPGQESTYLIKEAKAFLGDSEPDPSDYPLLVVEAAACNWTLEYTVQYVMQTAAMFRQVAAAVEGLRRGAIIAVESATTQAAIDAATTIT